MPILIKEFIDLTKDDSKNEYILSKSLIGSPVVDRPYPFDNLWKSQGGTMLNGVPREVSRAKPDRPQAPMVLAAGLPEGLHSP